MARNACTTEYDDQGFPVRAAFNAAIAAAAGTTVVKGAPGRLVAVQVTAAGTSSDNATIYDNASAGSGTVLAVIPGGGSVGARIIIDAAVANGITVVNVASGPGFTVNYS